MLIAGIGDAFRGDDGFGVEVVRRLLTEDVPGWVRVADFGVHGIRLAQELLEGGYELTILVDASPRGRKPGDVYLIEPDRSSLEELAGIGLGAPEDHPRAVFRRLRRLETAPGRVLIVGCEPARTEGWFSLSEPVRRAVDEAIRLIREVIANGMATSGARKDHVAGVANR